MTRKFDPDILAKMEARKTLRDEGKKQDEVINDFEELQEAENEQNRRDTVKLAKLIRQAYEEFITVGFTCEQAWELVTIQFTNATKRTLF